MEQIEKNEVSQESCDYEYISFPEISNFTVKIVEVTHYPLRLHNVMELIYVMDGSLDLISQGSRSILNAGDMAILDIRQAHEVFSLDGNVVRHLCVQISPFFFRRYFPEIDGIRFKNVDFQKPELAKAKKKIVSILLLLAKKYFDKEPRYELSTVALVNLLMQNLLNAVPWSKLSEAESAAQQAVNNRIRRIVDYVEQHYTEKVLLSDIAENEGLNPGYLSHFFKKQFLMSFQEYVTMLRYERARQYLLRTDMTLTDICWASGFQDCRQMKSVFLKLSGYAPMEYKHLISEKNADGISSFRYDEITSDYRFLTIDEAKAFFRYADESNDTITFPQVEIAKDTD